MLRPPAVSAALSLTHRGNHRDLGVAWLTLPAGASITGRATRLQDFRRNAIVCNSSLCGFSLSKVAISAAVADRQCVGKISRPHPRHAPTPICRARTSPMSSLKTHTSVPSLGAVAIGSYLPRSTMGCHPLGLIGASLTACQSGRLTAVIGQEMATHRANIDQTNYF